MERFQDSASLDLNHYYEPAMSQDLSKSAKLIFFVIDDHELV